MRVRIYSWFRSGNIGDILIAKQIKEIFSPLCRCVFFDIVSGCSVEEAELLQYTPQKGSLKGIVLKSPFLRELLSLKNCFSKKSNSAFCNIAGQEDLAVFAGGNSIMELSKIVPASSIILYRRVALLKRQGYKVAFCFCGCGPFNHKMGRFYAKKTIVLLDFISTRDDKSYEICKSLGWKGGRCVWRDPVLSYHPPMKECMKNTIAVNVYFGNQKQLHDGMRNAYIHLIQALIGAFPDKKICLYVSESADTPQAESVRDAFLGKDAVYLQTMHSAADLFELYSSSIVVIGARMHSLITAIICRIPIAAISWQEKVTSLMEYFEKGEYLVSQAAFIDDPTLVAQMAQCALQMYKMESDGIEEKLAEIARLTESNVAQFLEIMERECNV